MFLRSSVLSLLCVLGAASCGEEEDPFCDGDPPPFVHLPSVGLVDSEGRGVCWAAGTTVHVASGARDVALAPSTRGFDGALACNLFDTSEAFSVCSPGNNLTVTLMWPGCGTFTKSVVGWRGEEIRFVTDCGSP